MVVFGTIGLFVKNINLTSGEIALYRAALASVLIGLFFLVSGKKLSVKEVKKELFLLLLSGAAMGFNWIFLFEAYNYTSVSVATLSYYFAPVIVTLVCPLLFKEKMNMKKWICFTGSTLGIVLITGIGNLSENTEHIKGIALGLSAAVLYATVILINKYIKNVGGIERTFFQFIAAIVVLLPYVALTSGFNIASLDGVGWGYLLTVGLIHTGITYCLYFSSIKHIPGQKAAILSYIDPLVAVLCSAFILGETMLPMQIASGIMILGFTLYNELTGKKRG